MDDYQTLLNFWDQAYAGHESSDVTKAWEDLIPSKKQLEALRWLSDAKKILDYGCGQGWGAIALTKCGAKDVQGVEVSENAVASARALAATYKSNARFEAIDLGWLKKCPEAFDGLFCSNVLDVIPLEAAKEVLEGFAHIVQTGGKVVISLNFFMTPQDNPERHMTAKGRYLYVDGVLRLSCLTDDEWAQCFHEWFDVEKLEHYAWPGEKAETRRLFYLKRK